MAVRGRNLANDVGMTSRMINLAGNATAAADGSTAGTNWIAIAARSSIVLKELSVTFVAGTGGPPTPAANATLRIYRTGQGGAAVLCEIAISTLTAIATEWTTRDGSLAFTAGFKNESDRVFPKGTEIGAEWHSDGDGNTGAATDRFAISCSAHEFGAPPQ